MSLEIRSDTSKLNEGGKLYRVALDGSKTQEKAFLNRVILLFPMPKTFSEITKDLEITQRKLSATSDLGQRRVLLRQMRQLLEQADDLIQKLERQIPPESK